MNIPRSEQMQLPSEYGSPAEVLAWEQVDELLRDAAQYWVASVRPDGHPHVVPRDGMWIDDAWYYGGSDATVHNRNLRSNPALTMHIGDGMTAVIVEGETARCASMDARLPSASIALRRWWRDLST